MANMFGVIAAGRMVQTDFVQVDFRKCVVKLSEASEINHVVVFLTGQQLFPEGFGGQIYLSLRNSASGEDGWHLLGHITNAKPSAIFRIANLRKAEQGNSVDVSFFTQTAPMLLDKSLHAQIGISMEPLLDILNSTPADALPATLSNFTDFAHKMLGSFVNFVASYGTGSSTGDYIPLNTVKLWYESYQRRLDANPYFWRS